MRRYIIHHDDADGRCAAAIAGRDALRFGTEPRYFGLQYGDPVPWEAFDLFDEKKDEFWMLDFSLPLADMKRIQNVAGYAFTWIDHHQTAIDDLDLLRFLEGKRDPAVAACLLTWAYCHEDIIAPFPVRLIADRDIWQFDFGDDTRYFHEIFCQKETHPGSDVWDTWLNIHEPEALRLDLMTGKVLYDARIRDLEATATRLGREEPIFGPDYTTLTVNYPGTGEMGQVIQHMGYEIAHCYIEDTADGRLIRRHHVYSEKVDVGALARKRGGGGHPHAAGWVEQYPVNICERPDDSHPGEQISSMTADGEILPAVHNAV